MSHLTPEQVKLIKLIRLRKKYEKNKKNEAFINEWKVPQWEMNDYFLFLKNVSNLKRPIINLIIHFISHESDRSIMDLGPVKTRNLSKIADLYFDSKEYFLWLINAYVYEVLTLVKVREILQTEKKLALSEKKLLINFIRVLELNEKILEFKNSEVENTVLAPFDRIIQAAINEKENDLKSAQEVLLNDDTEIAKNYLSRLKLVS